MSVIRLSTSVQNAPAVNVQSCVFGIECEVKEKTDPKNVVFELVGDEAKIGIIAMKTHSTVVSNLGKVRI